MKKLKDGDMVRLVRVNEGDVWFNDRLELEGKCFKIINVYYKLNNTYSCWLSPMLKTEHTHTYVIDVVLKKLSDKEALAYMI